VESPFIEMGTFVTLSYFVYFVPLLPLVGFLENAIIQHQLRYAVLPFLFLTEYTVFDYDSVFPFFLT